MYNTLKGLISSGNRKIDKNTSIFNLTSGTDCPMKNDCFFGKNKTCYALKAERMYPDCLPYRRRQASYWYNTPRQQIIDDFIRFFRTHKRSFLRFNESGDIDSVWDLRLMDEIAVELFNHYGIRTYTYTHNVAVLRQFMTEFRPINGLNVNLSVDMDNRHLLTDDFFKDTDINLFVGVPKAYIGNPDNSNICKGGCGSKCFRCMYGTGKLTYIAVH